MSKKQFFHLPFLTALIFLLAPSVALASWWNPFSWNMFNSNDVKTQILENRIQELEKKLNVATTIKTSTTSQKTITTTSSPTTLKPKTIVVNNCRPEVKITTVPPYQVSQEIRTYFNGLIDSNASIDDLERVRKILISYREKTIQDSISSPDPLGSMNSGVAYSPDQLRSINAANESLYDSAINYYYSWIITLNKIISDKKDNGCIDGRDLYDYY